jgi:hypothetical protein
MVGPRRSTRAAAAGVDLEDTTRCPRGGRCAACGGTAGGGTAGGLAVATADTPVGVLCLTLCAGCADHARVPTLSWVRAADQVALHCGHLGSTVDDMAARLTLRGGGAL